MSSTWLLVLTVFNLVVLSVLTIQVFLKLKEKKEDLRLAKGLQLLQNKISILQDLSDKTDHQVHKIVQVIDKKSGDIQSNMAIIDSKIAHVEAALIRATEISKNLATQVSPQTMSEMQKTSRHVQAAKLANQGFTREQIMDKVDLNPAEIDLIFKVNKDQLQFAEDQLPGWVGGVAPATGTVDTNELSAFGNLIKAQKSATKATVNNAQTALVSTLASSVTMPAMIETPVITPATTASTSIVGATATASANMTGTTNAQGQTVTPYVFKKIEPQKF